MPGTRECPYCKMQIRSDASVCPHCQRDSDPEPVAASSTSKNTGTGCAILIAIAVIIAVWSAISGSRGGGNFTVTSSDFTAIDEANLAVFVVLENMGDDSAEAECEISAHDSSGQVGFDIFSWDGEVAPGDEFTGRANVRIEDEGAFRVVNVEIEC